MKNSKKKGVVDLLFFVIVCGVLTVLQNSFLSFFPVRAQLPNLLLSFLLTDIYFKRESYLVNLFKAGGAAFFLSAFSAVSWTVFLGAVAVTVFFLKFATDLIRKNNIITFLLASWASLLFYDQVRLIILFVERGRFELITVSNIIGSLLTLFCSFVFYFFYVRFGKIKKN